MILTKEQHQKLEQCGNVHLKVDGLDCVLVRSDVFQHVSRILADDWSHDDLRAMLTRAFESSDWNSPEMDIYDDYDRH